MTEKVKRVLHFGRFILEFLIDTIAPRDPLTKSIERMTSSEFMGKIRPLSLASELPGILSFFSYRDPLVQKAILAVKLYGNKRIARLLGNILYDLLLAESYDLASIKNFSDPIIMPIPMTRRALRKRGWNQCELIVEEICKLDKSRTFRFDCRNLIKTRDTADQVGKSRTERLKNIKGSFSMRYPKVIVGQNVIIFDDIVTTGATIREAKRTVLHAGAKKVLCVAIAH